MLTQGAQRRQARAPWVCSAHGRHGGLRSGSGERVHGSWRRKEVGTARVRSRRRVGREPQAVRRSRRPRLRKGPTSTGERGESGRSLASGGLMARRKAEGMEARRVLNGITRDLAGASHSSRYLWGAEIPPEQRVPCSGSWGIAHLYFVLRHDSYEVRVPVEPLVTRCQRAPPR